MKPQIVVEGLEKRFRIAKRERGLWGAVKGLAHREYEEVAALHGVSFSIEPGELVGYIGPNGAGKSTTIKILSGILVPSAGRCETIRGADHCLPGRGLPAISGMAAARERPHGSPRNQTRRREYRFL